MSLSKRAFENERLAVGAEETELEAHMTAQAAREIAAELLVAAEKADPGATDVEIKIKGARTFSGAVVNCNGSSRVCVFMEDEWAEFTPSQARELARALEIMASEAERK